MPKGGKKSNKKSDASAYAMVKRLERRMQGCTLKCRADPPSVTTRPWFNLVVVLNTSDPVTTEVVHTMSTVRTQLATQLFLDTDSTFEARIRELRVWGPLGGVLTATVCDPTANSIELAAFSDTGSVTSRPHFGYMYPDRVATTASLGSSNAVLKLLSPSASIAGAVFFEVHYLVQFRFYDSP